MEINYTAAKPRVLVCPMDWGLGHASRCIPVVNLLIEREFEVIIAAENKPLAFLRNEFPQLRFIRFPSYKISYPAKGCMAVRMLFSLPSILKGIRTEHRLLEDIIKENNVAIVISDNRYGLWSDKVFSVFITHQLMIKCPLMLRFLEPLLYRIIRSFISKYDECWIPDFEGAENLSGDLSHKYPLPANSFFINPLSRFSDLIQTLIEPRTKNEEQILVILSGPEPQRTILEKIIISNLKSQISNLKSQISIVLGNPDEDKVTRLNEKIVLYSHVETGKLFDLIISSDIVVCRSGYSGIMDMAAIGKKAVFIPTPGQTEQEFLAEYLSKMKFFFFQRQSCFNMMEALEKSKDFKGIRMEFDKKALEKRIDNLLNQLNRKS